jgi:hypothetical protein
VAATAQNCRDAQNPGVQSKTTPKKRLLLITTTTAATTITCACLLGPIALLHVCARPYISWQVINRQSAGQQNEALRVGTSGLAGEPSGFLRATRNLPNEYSLLGSTHQFLGYLFICSPRNKRHAETQVMGWKPMPQNTLCQDVKLLTS